MPSTAFPLRAAEKVTWSYSRGANPARSGHLLTPPFPTSFKEQEHLPLWNIDVDARKGLEKGERPCFAQ